MAQLIKIGQCVSRYQIDVLRYANRFIWLKNRRKAEWQASKFRTLSGRMNNQAITDFYDWLYRMQVGWAMRTPEAVSRLPEDVTGQTWLPELLRKVSDVGFFFYYPILLDKNAEVQLDSLLLTGDTLWCIRILQGEKGSVYQEKDDRKWTAIRNGGSQDILNPLISLNRSQKIIAAFLAEKNLKIHVMKAVFAPDGFIEFVREQRDLFYADLRTKDNWYRLLSAQSLFLKRRQVDIARALLEHLQTVAEPRQSDLPV